MPSKLLLFLFIYSYIHLRLKSSRQRHYAAFHVGVTPTIFQTAMRHKHKSRSKPLIRIHSGPVILAIRSIDVRVSLSNALQLEFPTVTALRNQLGTLVEASLGVAHEYGDFLSRAEVTNPGTISVGLALFQDFPLDAEVLPTVFELPNVLRQSSASTLVGVSEAGSMAIVSLLKGQVCEPRVSFGCTIVSLNSGLIHKSFRQTLPIKGAVIWITAVSLSLSWLALLPVLL